jgi:omega-hydroxy-beta-dihydromenaquinone-9 sulfotransferase
MRSVMLDKPIFIVGLPRSGSTLWLNIFFGHPDIYRVRGEMLFLTSFKRDFRYFLRRYGGDLSKRASIDEIVDVMFCLRPIPGISGSFWRHELEDLNEPNFKRRLADLIWKSDKSLSSFFKIVLEEITRARAYNRFCTKFPVEVGFVSKLLEWYPEGKVVHVVRDPRGVAASRSNDPGGTQARVAKHPSLGLLIRKLSMSYGVAQYLWTSRLHQRFRGQRNYSLFRFEDLLADPEREVQRLCEFTETAFAPTMLAPKQGQASSLTGRTSSGFNREAAEHWRKLLSPREERLILWLTRASRRRFELGLPDERLGSQALTE